jgi:hypothetical protein
MEQTVLDLVEKVKSSGMSEGEIDQVNQLLLRGGVRAGVESNME